MTFYIEFTLETSKFMSNLTSFLNKKFALHLVIPIPNFSFIAMDIKAIVINTIINIFLITKYILCI